MPTHKMQCFIASAFGRRDVDKIYRHGILPVLRKLKIAPTRVDRVEHNEDIDDKIFQLLNEADLCIADLTYSRPSVYYEAGYASARRIPVIHTARKDHFRDSDDDPYGIHRVHFDLQMKNIIDWSSPSQTFQRRLARRIRHVTATLRVELAQDLKREQFEAAFSKNSQAHQLALLTTTAKNLFKSRGFQIEKEVQRDGAVVYHPDRFSARHSRATIDDFVRFVAVPSILKSHLDQIRWLDFAFHETNRKPRRIMSHVVLASLRSASNARIADALSRYSPLDQRHFRRDFDSAREKIPTTAYIHIIDAVRSKEEFAGRLRNIFNDYKIDA